MRRAAKKDNSHKELERHLTQLGIAFLDCSQLKNALDIIVFFRGESYHIDMKSREYASKANQEPANRVNLLTEGERLLYDAMWEAGVAYYILFDTDEVMRTIQAMD